MRTAKIPRAPKNLSKSARSLWRRINEGWLLDIPALVILEQALRHYDRAEEAKRLIETEGMTVTDDKGRLKESPLVAVERKARDSMVRCLRALNLDLEPLHDRPGRPGGR